MPFAGGFQYNVNSNRIVYVADVVIPAAFRITVDHIDETTVGHGVETGNIGDTTRGKIMVLGGA